jgi:DNA-binding NtrC family response regulator
MVHPTILTVTTDTTLLGQLRKQIHEHVGVGTRMVVTESIEEACSLMDSACPNMIMVHCTGESARYEQIDQLLWSASVLSRPIPVLVLAERYRTDQATTLFRMGVSDYISRTHHLDQIGLVFTSYLPLRGSKAEDEPSLAESDLVHTGHPVSRNGYHAPSARLVM